jgi:hypothetical protein
MSWLKVALTNPYVIGAVACMIGTAISIVRVFIIRVLKEKGVYSVAPLTMWFATLMLAMNSYGLIAGMLKLEFGPLILGAAALSLFDMLFVKFPLPYQGGQSGK